MSTTTSKQLDAKSVKLLDATQRRGLFARCRVPGDKAKDDQIRELFTQLELAHTVIADLQKTVAEYEAGDAACLEGSSWVVDQTNDGTYTVKHYGYEMPTHLLQHLLNCIVCGVRP